ncbi:MAG: hypothetical protein J7M25_15595 [Deltaproteobacteria bacterium]|nr:hypothetical protein [Deltaproteobacteria bacterium]
MMNALTPTSRRPNIYRPAGVAQNAADQGRLGSGRAQSRSAAETRRGSATRASASRQRTRTIANNEALRALPGTTALASMIPTLNTQRPSQWLRHLGGDQGSVAQAPTVDAASWLEARGAPVLASLARSHHAAMNAVRAAQASVVIA